MQDPIVLIGKKYVEKVSQQIAAARQSIDIIVYDWRLRPSLPTHPVSLLVRALLDAQRKGVRIRALVNSADVQRNLKLYGIDAKVLQTQKLMHAKMMLIDNRVAVIGSHNYTQSAFTSNLEISLCCTFESQDNELTQYFKNLWGV